jgi:tetratricopeptide (TPR) repeat protein
MSVGRVCLFFFIAFAVRGQLSSQIGQDIEYGQVLQSQGRFAEAERQFESAVRAAELTRAPPDLQVSALSNLASIQIDLSRLDEAARTYQKALRTLQKGKSSGG